MDKVIASHFSVIKDFQSFFSIANVELETFYFIRRNEDEGEYEELILFDRLSYLQSAYNIGVLINNKPAGFYIENIDGVKYTGGFCVNGKEEGLILTWLPDGEVNTKGNCLNGEKVGFWSYGGRCYEKRRECFYVKGKETGFRINYDIDQKLNNKKFSQGFVENGKEIGFWINYWPNGEKKIEGHYVNGQRTGLWIYYWPNGKKKLTEFYKNCKKIGPRTLYYKNGRKAAQGEFVNGKETGLWTLYYKNGRKAAQGEFVNGKENDSWVFWDKHGKVRNQDDYKIKWFWINMRNSHEYQEY